MLPKKAQRQLLQLCSLRHQRTPGANPPTMNVITSTERVLWASDATLSPPPSVPQGPQWPCKTLLRTLGSDLERNFPSFQAPLRAGPQRPQLFKNSITETPSFPKDPPQSMIRSWPREPKLSDVLIQSQVIS